MVEMNLHNAGQPLKNLIEKVETNLLSDDYVHSSGRSQHKKGEATPGGGKRTKYTKKASSKLDGKFETSFDDVITEEQKSSNST